jgi:hypothetical protein
MKDDGISNHTKRGRPKGHKLSEETKEKIRIKRLGTHHSQKTRDKISKSLSEFFNCRRSVSDSLGEEYIYISEDASRWIFENDEEIDENLKNVITNKRIASLRQIEIALGMDVDQFFGHDANPEFLLLLKERIEEGGDKEILNEFISLI